MVDIQETGCIAGDLDTLTAIRLVAVPRSIKQMVDRRKFVNGIEEV